MTRTHGFTLIELLIIIAVLGIVFAIGFVNLNRWVLSNQVRQAASQLASDISGLRSAAVRTSRPASLTLLSGGRSYTLTVNGTTRTVSVPNDVLVAFTSGNSTVTYSAPYGEIDVASRTVTLSKTGAASSSLYLVGVTGKVTR